MSWRRVLGGCLLALWLAPVAAAPVTGGACASAHPLATQTCMTVLAEGGNAFDAAVATSAMLAVAEPFGSGIGGGGFFLVVAPPDKAAAVQNALGERQLIPITMDDSGSTIIVS